jgi:hypothetical protein
MTSVLNFKKIYKLVQKLLVWDKRGGQTDSLSFLKGSRVTVGLVECLWNSYSGSALLRHSVLTTCIYSDVKRRRNEFMQFFSVLVT